MTFRIDSIYARLVIGVVAINLFVYLVAGAALLQSRTRQEASARTTTQNLARSAASTVSGILEKLDVALNAASMRVARELATGRLDEAGLSGYLRSQKALLRDFEEMWVVDAAGNMRAGTRLAPEGTVNISDREYFQQAREAPDGRLVISQPLMGRVTKTWSIMIAKRINLPDGSFGGVAVASLRARDFFGALFSTIDLGANGIAALRDEQMTLLSRHAPGMQQRLELGARGISAEGHKAVARNPASGTFLARSPVDGVERVLSYERLARYPLYVFVGLERRELLGPWLSEVQTAAALLLFFSLVTALYTRSNYNRTRAQLTAHEAEERAVRLERARLQQILDTAPVGIAFASGGKLQFANPKAIGMFGVREDKEVGQFYVDPGERVAVEEQMRQGKVVTRDVRMRTTSGAVLDMLVTYVPTVFDQEAGALSWLIDITERKKAEDHIRKINFRNDTALGLTRSGYWEVPLDGSGCYLTSERACEIFGDLPNAEYRYRLEDWIANVDCVDPEIGRDLRAQVQDVLQGGAEAVRALYPYRRPIDGAVVWIQSHGKVACDASGRRVAVYGAAQDITEFVRVQHELASAKDAATAATRAKSEFLANMSHEIRTPLNAILGLAHLLRRDHPSPQQAHRLQQIGEAGQHLLDLINDVLDLSKIEARRLQLDSSPISLDDVIRQVVAVIGPQAQAKGLRLEVRCEPVPGRVRGDATRLRQALLNYLSNAIKFTDKGRVSLRGTVQGQGAEHVCLRFEVEDSGIGIPADRIPSLFQPFEQVDVSTSRKVGGTGLGLAITRYLAAMMGGEVGVTSTPGQGSVFWFTVCLEKAHASEDAECGIDSGATAAAVRERHGGCRVLLAEDNAIGAEVATDMLQDAGLLVDLARDGAEAVNLASARRYDMVLMDMQMPGMDGLAATVAIRRLPGWATQPIVALTANALAEDRVRCLDAGMNDFMSKPISPDELYRALMKWLAPGGAASAALPAKGAGAALEVQAPSALTLEEIEALAGMDPQRLEQFRPTPDKYVRLFGALVEQYEEQLPLLRDCISNGDAEQGKSIVHALKGAAALLGADALMHAAARLEEALKSQRPGPELVDKLQAIAAALCPLQHALRCPLPVSPGKKTSQCPS